MTSIKWKNIKEWLEKNKKWIDILTTIALGIMAIIISTCQLYISCSENDLIDKQTDLIKNQNTIIKLQTEFLYTPNLFVEFSTPVESNLYVKMRNDGKNVIKNVGLRVHYLIYDNKSHNSQYFQINGNDFKSIDSISIGQEREISLMHCGIYEAMERAERLIKVIKNGNVNNYNSDSSAVFAYIMIKYHCGPDEREFTLKRFVELLQDNDDKKIYLDEVGNFFDETDKINILKSLGLF
jgi:hypothetical protein